MIKAVIFDMDGVVVDSTDYDYIAWKHVLSEFNVNLTFKQYKSFLGMKGTEVVKRYVSNVSEEQALEIQNKKESFLINQVHIRGIKPIKGALEFIKNLKNKNHKIALATASPLNKLEAIFNKLKIKDLFDAITSTDEIKNGKPNPEVFLKAAQKLAVSPTECIVIEDAPNGVKAAKSGNFICVAITTTHSAKELKEADHIIDSYDQFDWSWLE